MKFQVQTVAALALASGSVAFSPAPRLLPSQHRQQQQQQQLYRQGAATTTEIAMAPRRNDENNNSNMDFLGKAAMSFFAASVVAVASTTGVLAPVEPAFAASSSSSTTPNKEKVMVETATMSRKKLAPEEKIKITSKQNLDLAEQTLKEYQKYVSEAKGSDKKASAAFKAEEKVVAAAKKVVISDSDKLSAAKNQKMPQTAVKELTTKSGKSLFTDVFT
jgi:hypothetical protein